VGTAAWRKLWDSAKDFAEKAAFPGKTFPDATDGAYCVLCQQPLGKDARGRFDRFDKFVRDRSASDAAAAAKGLDILVKDMENAPTALGPANTLEDLRAEDAVTPIKVEEYLELLGKRRTALLRAAQDNSWDSVPDQPEAIDGPIRTLAAAYEREA